MPDVGDEGVSEDDSDSSGDMDYSEDETARPEGDVGQGFSSDEDEEDPDEGRDEDQGEDAVDEDEDDGSEDDGPEFTFDDEDEDLLSLDEIPDIPLQTVSDEEEPEPKGKRKRGDERKERRKKRKELPLFGSYEDYQALIEAGGEESE